MQSLNHLSLECLLVLQKHSYLQYRLQSRMIIKIALPQVLESKDSKVFSHHVALTLLSCKFRNEQEEEQEGKTAEDSVKSEKKKKEYDSHPTQKKRKLRERLQKSSVCFEDSIFVFTVLFIESEPLTKDMIHLNYVRQMMCRYAMRWVPIFPETTCLRLKIFFFTWSFAFLLQHPNCSQALPG